MKAKHRIWRYRSISRNRFEWILWCPADGGYTIAVAFETLTTRRCAGCGKG